MLRLLNADGELPNEKVGAAAVDEDGTLNRQASYEDDDEPASDEDDNNEDDEANSVDQDNESENLPSAKKLNVKSVLKTDARRLLTSGANVNAVDNRGYNAVHHLVDLEIGGAIGKKGLRSAFVFGAVSWF